jgi:alpha-ketoglutarate-dependent taurine dioxygenase
MALARLSALTPTFGTEVHGVDIGGGLSSAQWGQLERAFHGRSGGLLLLRGQTANAASVKAFAARFGVLEDNAKYLQMGLGHQLHPEHQEILSVGNALGERSMMIAVPEHAPLLWHCDDSFRSPQPMGSCFFCVEAPAHGGETWFASGCGELSDCFGSFPAVIGGLS